MSPGVIWGLEGMEGLEGPSGVVAVTFSPSAPWAAPSLEQQQQGLRGFWSPCWNCRNRRRLLGKGIVQGQSSQLAWTCFSGLWGVQSLDCRD